MSGSVSCSSHVLFAIHGPQQPAGLLVMKSPNENTRWLFLSKSAQIRDRTTALLHCGRILTITVMGETISGKTEQQSCSQIYQFDMVYSLYRRCFTFCFSQDLLALGLLKNGIYRKWVGGCCRTTSLCPQ